MFLIHADSTILDSFFYDFRSQGFFSYYLPRHRFRVRGMGLYFRTACRSHAKHFLLELGASHYTAFFFPLFFNRLRVGGFKNRVFFLRLPWRMCPYFFYNTGKPCAYRSKGLSPAFSGFRYKKGKKKFV
jgi:hypothetical protein